MVYCRCGKQKEKKQWFSRKISTVFLSDFSRTSEQPIISSAKIPLQLSFDSDEKSAKMAEFGIAWTYFLT